MPVVGTMSQGSKSLQFLIARTDSGFAQEVAQEVPEEMTTPGVNGRRWRTLFKQYANFNMFTIVEASTYGVALQYKNRAEKFMNQLVSLNLIVSGTSYNFKQAHVNGVVAVAVPGPVVASGSTGGLAHVAITWNIALTDFDQQPQAGS